MSRLNNTAIDIPVILGFIALIAFMAYAQAFIFPSSKRPESVVTGKRLVTHYVGNAALELPDSWTMDTIQATFYLTDQENGPRISFQEIPAKAGRDAAEELANNLKILSSDLNKSNDLRTASFGRTDISAALGHPAMIYIKDSRPGGNFGLSVVGAYTYFPPPGHRLEMILELATPQASLLFTYVEAVDWSDNTDKLKIVADKQKILTDWALAFIDRFQCLGYNSSQSQEFLATKFGRIDIGKKAEYKHYVLTARFSQKQKSLRVSDISFSLSSLPAKEPVCDRDIGNRKPARPLGREIRKTTTTGSAERLDLTWQNCSNTYQFSPQDPSFSIAYCGYAINQDVLEEAEILTMWDTLIKSLRILPDGN